MLCAYGELDLLVLDNLFLPSIFNSSAELLQSVVHQRYKRRASIIGTSPRVVQDWESTLATPPLEPPPWTASCAAPPCSNSKARTIA
jgi:DNA replication protein DnaC